MRSLAVCIACVSLSAKVDSAGTELSFGAPFNDINAFSGLRNVGEWEVGGSSNVHRSFTRLTAEGQGQKGWLSSSAPLGLKEWSALLEIRASGKSGYLYGDGLALWLVSNVNHIEGDVFGREDFWKGLGVFFDTFQNLDHQHHHKHPYIYAMTNDGTKHYVPDADNKLEPANQVLPGGVENSGCSFDFRYHEGREDVSVLNHTRVHLTYKNRNLKMRLQQTSPGVTNDWYQCFDIKDVDIPDNAYFGMSAATGDLVDNHDIIQFNLRSLEGVSDPEADYDTWEKGLEQERLAQIEEHDLRAAESLQRDYQRVLRAQASAIKNLNSDVELLKQQLEFTLSSMNAGILSTKSQLDHKSQLVDAVTEQMNVVPHMKENIAKTETEIDLLRKAVAESTGGNGWRMPFFVLLLLLFLLAGIGYNRYKKITKSHFL